MDMLSSVYKSGLLTLKSHLLDNQTENISSLEGICALNASSYGYLDINIKAAQRHTTKPRATDMGKRETGLYRLEKNTLCFNRPGDQTHGSGSKTATWNVVQRRRIMGATLNDTMEVADRTKRTKEYLNRQKETASSQPIGQRRTQHDTASDFVTFWEPVSSRRSGTQLIRHNEECFASLTKVSLLEGGVVQKHVQNVN